VFTARYALSPYIKQIRFVFKGLKCAQSAKHFRFSSKPLYHAFHVEIFIVLVEYKNIIIYFSVCSYRTWFVITSYYKISSYLKFCRRCSLKFSAKIMSLKLSFWPIKCAKSINNNFDISANVMIRYGVVHPLLFEPFPSLITTKKKPYL
jgi:hypothetical protein